MAKNLPRVAPIQRIVGIPVTDPGLIAAVEEEFKRERRLQRALEAGGDPEDLLTRFRGLSAEQRFVLVRELMATLAADQQGELLAHFVAQASNGVLQKLDGPLRQRLNGESAYLGS